MNSFYFDKIKYYTGSYNELTDLISHKLKDNSDKPFTLVHINLRNYYYLNKDKCLKNDISNLCFNVIDGIGMLTGLRMKGFKIINDLNGTDLFPVLMNKISLYKPGIFMLGSDDKTLSNAAIKIKSKYPGIKLLGLQNGYFTESDEPRIINRINNCRPDILITGMGFPLQEKFILKYRDVLDVSVIWNAGGLFDFISGNKPRAPLIMRRIRLEWLFRFMLEPERMFFRNTVCAPLAFSHIITREKEQS